jgi:hypothetical protein
MKSSSFTFSQGRAAKIHVLFSLVYLVYSLNPSLCTGTLDVEHVKIVDTTYMNIIHCTLIKTLAMLVDTI